MNILKFNKTRNVKWLLIAWTAYILTFILQIIILWDYQDKLRNHAAWTNATASYFVGVLLILFFIIPLNRFISTYKTSNKIFILILGGFVFSVIFMGLTTIAQGILLKQAWGIWFWEEFKWYLHYHLHNVLKNYIFLTGLLYALTYFQRESEVVERESKLRNRLVEIQLSNLKNQFQPHFLFNALNSIVAVVEEDKNKAQVMLVRLSEILRESMDNRYDCEQNLKEEIAFLSKYLSIEKMRYENQLNYKFKIDPLSEQLIIPCLILQPMVENAIKHGFKRNVNNLEILIESREKTIWIKNNGARIEKYKYGQGLMGIKDRLKVMYGEKVSFKIYQEDEFVVNELQFL